MSDNKILCKKFVEVNQLKNKLENYPKEYRAVIINAINDICSEIYSEIHCVKNNETEAFKNMEIKLLEHRRRERAKDLTLNELAQYNGQEGKNAYVAVNGVIYDVTAVKAWSGGRHYGLGAGKDLSSYFNTCHNMQKYLIENLPVVGKLINT